MNENSKLTSKHRQDLRVLKLRGYPMAMKSAWHYKYREVNYFITTGTITIDPDIKHKTKGLEAVIALLEERYPKPEKPETSITLVVE